MLLEGIGDLCRSRVSAARPRPSGKPWSRESQTISMSIAKLQSVPHDRKFPRWSWLCNLAWFGSWRPAVTRMRRGQGTRQGWPSFAERAGGNSGNPGLNRPQPNSLTRRVQPPAVQFPACESDDRPDWCIANPAASPGTETAWPADHSGRPDSTWGRRLSQWTRR